MWRLGILMERKIKTWNVNDIKVKAWNIYGKVD